MTRPNTTLITLELPTHGTFQSTAAHVTTVRFMKKSLVAKEIARAYDGVQNEKTSHYAKRYNTSKYWMSQPKFVLDIVHAGLHHPTK